MYSIMNDYFSIYHFKTLKIIDVIHVLGNFLLTKGLENILIYGIPHIIVPDDINTSIMYENDILS